MRFRWAFVGVLFFAIGAGAWMLLRPPEAPALPPLKVSLPEAAESARSRPPEGTKLAASEVLKIDPRTLSTGPLQPVKASLHNDYVSAKNLKPLYDRLKASPEGQTGEGMYLLYEMLRRCANVTDGGRRPFTRPVPKREEFLAGIPANDPNRDKRIAAFDDMETNRCAGFEGISVSQAELNKLLADAVNAGDPKARAIQVEQEILQANRGRMNTATLSDAQLETLRQSIGSRDPGAMMVAGRLLSNTWNDLTVRVGTDGLPVEPRAFMNAWQILACEYGYPCGADNARVLAECALQGHCNASSLQDYLFYYSGSPHDSQLVSQYQSILRAAIESGDWSQIAMTRGPRPPGTPRMFFFGSGPGRR
jgi:hypothetical protein